MPVQYLQGDNWLGVALTALMRISEDQIVEMGAEALRRLSDAPLPGRAKRLLGECVEAYLPLDEQQTKQFEDLILSEAYEGVRAMNKNHL